MNRIIHILFALFLMAWANKHEPFYIPEGWPEPVYDFSKNPLTPEKILLGRALFHDPILSRDNTISCTSCHLQYTAFTHTDHDLSHGIDNRIGTRNSPTLMNLAWHKTFMWDGAVHHLDMQALAPISNPDEMDSSIEEVVEKLNNSPIYPPLFEAAYGDSIATGEHTLKAISAFMLTFVSANAKYDKVQRGEEKFTEQEQNGYQLFQKNCESCHREPLFTTNEFANNGLPIDTTLNDFGRMLITKNTADSLQFKIPTLRNIEFSYPYMHDGRFRKLSEILNHYTAVETIHELSKRASVETIHELSLPTSTLQKNIILTSNEKVDLIAFLKTLTDKDFLFNKDFSYPREILMPSR